MYLELQNVAAAMIAASTIASPPGPGDLRYSGASELGTWRLAASAASKPWEPSDSPAASRFDPRGVLGGESTRASLAFDWQRMLDTSRLEAAAFAKRSGIDLHSGRLDASSRPERFEQRERRSILGAALGWTTDGDLGALAMTHSVTARLRTETLDSDGAFRTPGGAATETVRADRLRQTAAALNFETETQLAARLRSVASLRYDAYRFGVSSDLAGHGGNLQGSLASPRVSLIAELSPGNELFVSAGRGYLADEARVPGAAIDPRNGAPIGKLDPLAAVTTTEAGIRGSFLPKTETTLAFFQARTASEVMLSGDAGIGEILRPALRQGMQLSARYTPVAWLAFDVQAAAFRARFRDGARERFAAAVERTASAAATVYAPNGWTASLLVNALGKNESATDDTRARPSTFVNARFARNLSKTTRVSVDVFNVFDRRVGDVDYFSAARLWSGPAATDSYLFNPAEPRGFRVKLRTTF